MAGRYTPWDFQPVRNAARLYVRNDQDLADLEATRGSGGHGTISAVWRLSRLTPEPFGP
ncbi:MAG: hypothetical protein ACLP2F_15120 [Steroidobacteraceae bacterium]